MTKTEKLLLLRIEELERQVRELQARPVYVPIPVTPQPTYPTWPTYPIITYSGQSNLVGGIKGGYQVWN